MSVKIDRKKIIAYFLTFICISQIYASIFTMCDKSIIQTGYDFDGLKNQIPSSSLEGYTNVQQDSIEKYVEIGSNVNDFTPELIKDQDNCKDGTKFQKIDSPIRISHIINDADRSELFEGEGPTFSFQEDCVNYLISERDGNIMGYYDFWPYSGEIYGQVYGFSNYRSEHSGLDQLKIHYSFKPYTDIGVLDNSKDLEIRVKSSNGVFSNWYRIASNPQKNKVYNGYYALSEDDYFFEEIQSGNYVYSVEFRMKCDEEFCTAVHLYIDYLAIEYITLPYSLDMTYTMQIPDEEMEDLTSFSLGFHNLYSCCEMDLYAYNYLNGDWTKCNCAGSWKSGTITSTFTTDPQLYLFNNILKIKLKAEWFLDEDMAPEQKRLDIDQLTIEIKENAKPIMELIEPVQDTLLGNKTPQLKITCEDLHLNPNRIYLEREQNPFYLIPNSVMENGYILNESAADWLNWQEYYVNLPSGTYQFSIVAFDNCSNYETIDLSFTKDCDPPGIFIISPEQYGEEFSLEPPDLHIRIDDENIDPAGVKCGFGDNWYIMSEVDGVSNEFIMNSDNSNHYLYRNEWTAQLDGTISIYFDVTDKMGNYNGTVIEVNKSSTIPGIFVVSPEISDYFAFNKQIPTIRVCATDEDLNPDSVGCYVGSRFFQFTPVQDLFNIYEIAPDNTDWSDFWGEQGEELFYVDFVAKDIFGNTGLCREILIKDCSLPYMIYDSGYYEDQIFSKPPDCYIYVKDRCTDIHSLSYSFDSVPDIENGNWTILGQPENNIHDLIINNTSKEDWYGIPDGDVLITFMIKDLALNVYSESVLLVKDTKPPEIEIIMNMQLNETAPDYNLNIEDAHFEDLYISHENIAQNYSLYEFTGTLPQEFWNVVPYGKQNITFYANDTVSQIGNISFTIFKNDTICPEIRIHSPMSTDEMDSLAPSYEISVTDVHSVSLWYSLDGGSTKISCQSNSGLISQPIWDKALTKKVQLIFYAEDSYGNIGQASVEFIRTDYIGGVDLNISPELILYSVGIISATMVFAYIGKKRDDKEIPPVYQ